MGGATSMFDVDTINYSTIVSSWSLNNWHHIVLTYDSTGKNQFWFDGQNKINSTNSWTPTDNNWTVLGSRYTLANFFSGRMDELAIFNRILNSTEVSQLNNGGAALTYNTITITLLSPSDKVTSLSQAVNFSVTVADQFLSGIKNVTLNVYNTTGIAFTSTNTSTLKGTYNFSNTFIDGNYSWNLSVYDNSNNLYASTTRSFTIASYNLNSISYNTSTYETALETFTINITVREGLTPTLGKLFYNDTTYSGATITNTDGSNYNISKTISIPLGVTNNTFYLNFTLNGIEQMSNISQQEINLVYFSFCNSTYTSQFVNYSFQDELTSTYINASIPLATFDYYLGDGTIKKTYTYTNNIDNYNYTFCATPTTYPLYVLPEIQYKKGLNYPQRIWQPNVQTYNSTITNKILYLLGSTDGIFVTYQVVDNSGGQIQGVNVNVTKTSDDSLVSSGVTDSAGLVTFFLNPDIHQTIWFSKIGYPDYITSQFPTQSIYTIVLSGATSTSINDYLRGISYNIKPQLGTTLPANTITNFNFTLSSSYWTLDSFGFNLYADNILVASNSSTNNGGALSVLFNTSNYSHIQINYFWTINSTLINTTSGGWFIFDFTEGTDWSIKSLFTDVSTYAGQGIFGLTQNALNLIIFIIIFISVGISSYNFGITSPAVISGIVFALIFFFDVGLGMINIGIGISHFPTIFVGLVTMGLIIKEATT